MAGRSDFLRASLPRQFKRMIAAGVAYGSIAFNHEKTVQKIFIDAHAHHRYVRNKRTIKDITSADHSNSKSVTPAADTETEG